MNRGASTLALLCLGLVSALVALSGTPAARAEPSVTAAGGPTSSPVGEVAPDSLQLVPVSVSGHVLDGPSLTPGLIDELAPTRMPPAQPLSSHTGYLPPPMDLSHLKGDRMPAGVSAAALPSHWDWRDYGIVTPVRDQGPCGACYAFAFIAAFESKLVRDGAGTANTVDFSENHAKECNWEELNNYGSGSWGSCRGGNAPMLANLYSQKGTVQEPCDPYVPEDVACVDTCPYQKTVLGWSEISGNVVPNTDVLKAYIQTYGPVHTSWYAGNGDAWDREVSDYDGSYTLYYTGSGKPNHGGLIVGWDDNLTHTGGSGGWIVKNSWGTGWGDAGYFTIAYGSASIGMDSGFISEWQDYDANGGLLYYDDAGWNASLGTGSLTGWGLVKFVPPTTAWVTRVEFWTTDATTDVDVYLYDSFDGNTMSGRRFAQEDLSFPEAGYHSVPVNPPVLAAARHDIVAVVRFTNTSYGYPLPLDDRGPEERGRTFRSYSGASGSWRDVGAGWDSDLAIRLRTEPYTPTAWAYLPIVLKQYVSPVGPVVTTTPVPVNTATPTLVPGDTPTPTLSPPPTHTLTPTPTDALTRTPTPTRSPTRTRTPTSTVTATQVWVNTPTRTSTPVTGTAVVVPLPGGPHSLAVNSGNNRLYVARSSASDVAVLDLGTLGWITNRPLDKSPHVVRVNPSLGRGYAAYGSPLYIFSCADDSLLGQIATSVYDGNELALDSSNHRVYVGDWTTVSGEQDKVLVYDGVSNNLVGAVDLGVSPDIERIGVAVNRTTSLAYAAYSGDEKIAIIRSDAVLQGRITPSQMAQYPYDPWVVVNAVTNRLYLRGEDKTVVIDLNSNSEVGTLSHTGLLAVDETRNRIYVWGLSRIYVYDGVTNLSLSEISLDKYRYTTDIVFDPATHRVLMAAPYDDVIVCVVD